MVSFRRKRQAWEELSVKALAALDEERQRALNCIERTKTLANERHRIMHDIIEHDAGDESRLKAFPPATPNKFGWPLDAARIEQTARDIARLTHDVLSIHRDPEIAPDASPRTQDTPNPRGPLPVSGTPGRHLANPRSRKPRR
jgi:hypothetical protein